MVVMGLPAAAPTCVMHDLAGTPPISTVQAPHCPSPQPYLLPVRSRSSRKTLSKLFSASTSTLSLDPFTLSSVILDINHPQERTRAHRTRRCDDSSMPGPAWRLSVERFALAASETTV